MCLATAPEVLLLDEPLAGMGAEETERMLALLAELKAGHAIALVEHDMDAVFRIADRITVMVNGAVIASDAPRAVRANADVQAAYLGEATEMSSRQPLRRRAAACTPGTAAATCCTAWTCTIDRGQTVGLLGRNGMGKSTLIRTLLGHVRAARGPHRDRRPRLSRARPHEVARRGVAYVPEGRGVFPNLSVRENLVMAARAGRDGRGDWTCERVLQTFPRLAERLDHLGGAAVRRRAADAVDRPRADDAARADHPRRSHRRPGAADRGRDLARDRPDPQQPASPR